MAVGGAGRTNALPLAVNETPRDRRRSASTRSKYLFPSAI
jgi:hypothetical protein